MIDWSLIQHHCHQTEFIKRCQDLFKEDAHNFNSYPSYLCRNIGLSYIHLPIDRNKDEPDRIYITTDKFDYVPLFLDKQYTSKNLVNYGLSNKVADNVLFYISNMRDEIKRLSNIEADYKDYIRTFKNFINLTDVVISVIVEGKDYPDISGISRILWLKENQEVGHAARIKVQDKKGSSNTRNWGYIECHSDFKEVYNPDSDLSPKEKKLIRAFVKTNTELIQQVYSNDPKNKIYGFDYFLDNLIKIDRSGNPVEKSVIDEWKVLLDNNKIESHMMQVVSKQGKNSFVIFKVDNRHFNVYHPEYGICFKRWFNTVSSFDKDDMNLFSFTVSDEAGKVYEVDIEGNILKQLK